MKIFDWVNRKFHQKDGFGRNTRKAELVGDEKDTQKLLLEHVAVADVLDGWRDGLLTIGTFGFHPLSEFYEKTPTLVVVEKEESEEEGEEDNELDEGCEMKEWEEEEEELSPLMLTAFGGGFGEENGVEADVTKMKKKKKKERTTLAELLSADCDGDGSTKRDLGKVSNQINSSILRAKGDGEDGDAIKKKGVSSFAKKLIPSVGDEKRLINKLNQLMKRMLKRKIHPDHEEKTEKRDGLIKPAIPRFLADE